MPTDPTLLRLLDARTPAEQDAAWRDFVTAHHRLILHTARAVVHEADGAMDAYAHMLECLRAEGFARLRSFRDDGRAKFTTWLVVVLRRIALDHVRRRLGRSNGRPSESTERRRRLDRLAGEALDLDQLAVDPVEPVDSTLQRAELSAALGASIAVLEPRERLLLSLRFDEGLPASRIARVMGYPTPFHVYRHLNSVVASLRSALAKRGVDGPAP